MARQPIDLTTAQPNGRKGEPAVTAFGKINDMTAEIYQYLTGFIGLPKGFARPGQWVGVIPQITGDGAMDICKRIDFHEDGGETKDYSARLESARGDPYWNWPGTARGLMMYHQGNATGPVGGNIAGFPTGALIERGSNSTSSYVRFADGTQICWGTIGGYARTDQQSGSGWHRGVGAAAFPIAFADTPSVTYSLRVRGDSGHYGSVMQNNEPTNGRTADCFLWSPSSNCIGQASYIAVGRWQ